MPRRRSFALPDLRRRRSPGPAAPTYVPADPARVVAGPMDPTLGRIRSGLVPHRRRLWFRRIIRRAWLVAAGIAAGVLVVAVSSGSSRSRPRCSTRPPSRSSDCLRCSSRRSGSGRRSARRRSPSTPRVAPVTGSRARLRSRRRCRRRPHPARPTTRRSMPAARTSTSSRPRAASCAGNAATPPTRWPRSEPDLFRPRFSPRPAVVARSPPSSSCPPCCCPTRRTSSSSATPRSGPRPSVRRSASRTSRRISKARASTRPTPVRRSPRPRELAQRLRERPGDLDLNLARVGALEGDVRAQLDPANEQRASSLAALSRSLSRAASGDPKKNPDGDPAQARQDLHQAGDELAGMSDEQKRDTRRATGPAPGAGEPGVGCRGPGAPRRGPEPGRRQRRGREGSPRPPG